MKKFLSSALLVLCIGISTPARAVTIQAGELTFGINGFLGFEYTYMTKMPMVIDFGGTPTIMPMSDVSFFNLRHFNLLFSIEREKLRGLINLHSDNLFATNDDQDTFKGRFEIQIAYGEYAFFEALRVRAGKFFVPFGIYNEVRYVLPVFSTVVLPFMYEPPRNYSEPVVPGTPAMLVSPMTPDPGNLMLWGTSGVDPVQADYYLYLTSGALGADGLDNDKDKGLGARVKLQFFDDVWIGGSLYTVDNKDAPEGREWLVGADLDLLLLSRLTLQAEYVGDSYGNRQTRYAFYLFAGYQQGRWNPYVRYDFLKDPEHLLFKKKQDRSTVGVAFNFTPNILIKNEYHFHRFLDRDGLPGGTARLHMFRSSLILIF